MAHEIVNGANGSVTWCPGLDCPRCRAEREFAERLRRDLLTAPCPGWQPPTPAIRLGGGIVMPPWGYVIIG